MNASTSPPVFTERGASALKAEESGVADAAVERAMRLHARLVYRVARAVLRNHHDAEDAAQDVFVRVLRLRRGLEGVEDERTWLARVAFRVALDRRSRPRYLSLDDAAATRALAALASAQLGADDVAAERQVRALVAEKVADLPGDLRHAVRLSTVAGLTSPEIAGILGIPEGTVRTRLMRARRMLRLALAAALAVLLAALGFVLRPRTEARTAVVVPLAPTPESGVRGISSNGEEGPGAAAGLRPAVGAPRGAVPSSPSKKIFFPSRSPLSEQERLLVAYVERSDPEGAAALSGFLDEPAPLPPLPPSPDEPPSN